MDTGRIVITGVNGFVGHHLARSLKAKGYTVIGIGHDGSAAATVQDAVDEYHSADLTEKWPEIPDCDGVIHLAGHAAVGPSFDKPQIYINENSAMVTHMGEYYLRQEKKPRILIVSSGAVYSPTQAMPISESGQINFSSPYVVSKITTEHQAEYYHNRGIECVVARPFNHIGPGQKDGFIVPDLYKKIVAATTEISVGSITTRRDYTDVRDVVDAYVKIITADTLDRSIYNVCSGKSFSGSEILNTLKDVLKKPDVSFVVDPALVRPTDAPDIFGDSSLLQEELGWHPTYSLQQTIRDFVAAQP